MRGYPLDALPFWAVLLATAALAWLAVELGYRVGRYRLKHQRKERGESVLSIQASILALLAFLLAITFGMAVERYAARKHAVLTEANAIGTCFLRADLLPEPMASEVRTLLREYVDTRIEGIRPDLLEAAILRSEELHAELWDRAVRSVDADPGALGPALFTQSLNEVIDLHEVRVVAGLYNRIPFAIWIALYTVSLLAMLSVGYGLGLSGSSRSMSTLALAFAFSIIIALVVDLDRPQSGLLTISQRAMEDVRETM
jgi:tetrahydromethanopterin S-methyltransferase subunit B